MALEKWFLQVGSSLLARPGDWEHLTMAIVQALAAVRSIPQWLINTYMAPKP